MTTKKKLIAIGVAASIITALFVWNPGGNIGSLASRMLGDNLPDHTFQTLNVGSTGISTIGSTAGTVATNPNHLNRPEGVAQYGNLLYVADTYSHRIKLINKNTGETVKVIGKEGILNSEFKYPFDIAIDEKNKFFYVADLNNHRVQRFQLEEPYNYRGQIGNYANTANGPGTFLNPAGIAIDSENNRLYVSDAYCRVQAFALSAYDPQNPNNAIAQPITGTRWEGFKCGRGNREFNSSSGYGPEAIAVDGQGNVYVADTYNNRIQKFTSSGEFIATIANYETNGSTNRNVRLPKGLFIDKGSYLYVSNHGYEALAFHRIQKFDLKQEGEPLKVNGVILANKTPAKLVTVYGTYGQATNQFYAPGAIFVDNNTNIYVADTYNNRISFFQQHIIVPTKPVLQAATPGVSQIALSWTAASPQGGTPILDYGVEFKKSGVNTDWIKFGDIVAPATGAIVTGLDADTGYLFRVYARNTAREVGLYSEVMVSKTLSSTRTLSFHANGGTGTTQPRSCTVIPPSGVCTIIVPANGFTRMGYAFAGWNTAADGNGTDYAVGATYTANAAVTLFAQWTPATTPITSVSAITGTAKVGSTLTAGAVSPTGATFTRQWQISGTANGTYSDISGQIGATYSPIATDQGKFIRVSVTGTGSYTGTVESTPTTAIAAADPIPVHGVCGTTNNVCTAGTSVDTADTTTRYMWSCNGLNGGTSTSCTLDKPQIEITATKVGLGTINQTSGPQSCTYCTSNPVFSQGSIPLGSTITLRATPASGYVFSSWSGCSSVSENICTIVIDENKTVTAQFNAISVNNYTITFNENDTNATGTMTTQTIASGASANLTANGFNNPGYTFAGWATTAGGSVAYANNANYTMGTANVNLYAKWTAITTTPTVVSVTSTKPDGAYRAGTIIPISIEFSEAVTVVGIPTLTLETGVNDVVVAYKETAEDGKTLIFEYTVAAGHTSNDLNYLNTTALALPTGASIKAGSTNASLTLPTLTSTSSLGGSKNIIIDTTAPAAPGQPYAPIQANVIQGSTAYVYIATSTSMIVNVGCSEGDRVRIYQALATTAAVQANCVNNLATLTLPLPAVVQLAPYVYFAKFVDDAGNESASSPTISVTLNPAPNSAPGTPDLDPLFDLGVSSIDNLTSSTQPRFNITCTSGAIVNIYDDTTLIGTASCVADTAQVLSIQPLSAGVHSITAKQIINGITSAASGALTLTIDTAPLNVTLARAADQSEPATSSTIRFTATFSRPIDSNSFICSDVVLTNAVCTNVALLSGNTFIITLTATTQGQVRVILYPGRVQTAAGNLNTESTGVNTVTYGTVITPPPISVTAQCSDLRRFATSNPRSSSLDDEDLCNKGNATNVSYSTSRKEWTYQCRSNDGSTDACTVSAILESAPQCEAAELPFDECRLTNTSNLYYFYEYLDCLGVAEKSSCNRSYGCPQEAKRQELVYIADQLRGIPLDEDNYDCQGNYTDTERGVASWVCEAAEKAQIAGLISATNTRFRPTDTMTRAEAYSVLMKSICVHPDTDYRNWQTRVAQEARELGFTVRTVSTFEPNKLILRQELYALAARIAEYKDENGDSCDDLPDELICEE